MGDFSDPNSDAWLDWDGTPGHDVNTFIVRQGGEYLGKLWWDDSWTAAAQDFDLVLLQWTRLALDGARVVDQRAGAGFRVSGRSRASPWRRLRRGRTTRWKVYRAAASRTDVDFDLISLPRALSRRREQHVAPLLRPRALHRLAGRQRLRRASWRLAAVLRGPLRMGGLQLRGLPLATAAGAGGLGADGGHERVRPHAAVRRHVGRQPARGRRRRAAAAGVPIAPRGRDRGAHQVELGRPRRARSRHRLRLGQDPAVGADRRHAAGPRRSSPRGSR